MAAAVSVAATAPSTVSDHDAAGPGAAIGRPPEATQKTTSPSSGVNAGSTARAIPPLAARATMPQPRLSSDASVQTQASVVLWSGRTAHPGGSGVAANT